MEYLLIGISMIFFVLNEILKGNSLFSRYILVFFCVVLVFFAGLRSGTGTDWPAYFYVYNNPNEGNFEIGFQFLNDLFGNLGFSFSTFLLFVNSISLFLMYHFFRKNASFYILGLLLYFSDLYLYYNFSGMRQAVAISFTCFSLIYAYDRKFIKFLGIVFLGSLFHSSAIAFLIVYFIPKDRISVFSYAIVIGLFVLVAINLTSFSQELTLYVSEKAENYLEIREKALDIKTLYIIGVIKRVIILIVIGLWGKYMLVNQKFRYFFNIYLLGFGIFCSSYLASPDIGVRLSSYFTIIEVILVCMLLQGISKKGKQILIALIFSFIAIYKIMGYMDNINYVYNNILALG